MFIVFFCAWIIFNGRMTIEIAIFGLVLAAAMYAFACAFLGLSPKKELHIIRLIPASAGYLAILLWEIIKANFTVMRMILSPRFKPEPTIVSFHAGLKTDLARVMLANSITLTPGTITVTLENDEYHVHCLDKSLSEDIEDSVFIRLLKKMEARHAQ